MQTFGYDLRFAIRGLRRNPVSFAVIVLALALGITVNAVVFSLVDSVLFKPLPGKNPERLVRLFSMNQENSNQLQPTAFPIYMQYRDAMKGFADLAAYRNVRVQFSATGGEGRQIYAAVVTGNFFPVLNIEAEKGRVFSPEDDTTRGANPVAILSDRLWRSLGSADVIGSSVRINGQSYTVVGIAPAALRDFDHVPDNFRLLLFVSAISFMVAVGFSLLATRREADKTLLDSLKGDHSQPSAHLTRRMPGHAVLVVFQIAASFVVLSCSGLLLRTLQQAAKVNLGFSTDHLLTASLDLSRQGYDKTRAAAMPEPILESLREIPGVESAALSMGPLLNRQPYQSSSKDSAKADCSNLDIVPVTPGYFGALQIPFLRGRDFSPTDGKNAPGVVIANQAADLLCWPGKDLIGEHLASVKTLREPFEVIGLVGNVKNAAGEENPKPLLYVSLPQFYEAFPWQMTLGIVVRTKLEPHEIMPSLISAIQRLDGDLSLNDIETPQETLAQEFSEQDFLSTLLLTFGAIALVLALAGLYGLLSYVTAKRTREFGIRLALGARREDVLYLVLQQGGLLVFGSVFIGLFGAIASARLIRNFLFGIAGMDPFTYFTIAAFVLLVGLAACSLPAARATRVDPVVALRDE